MKKAVLISAYDYYDVRVKYIYEALKLKGYNVTYYIASFNHYKKRQNSNCREEATMIHTNSYSKNVSAKRILSCLLFSWRVHKNIEKIQPELVYSIIPPNSLSWLLWKDKKRYGYKLILDIIDLWPESFSVTNKKLKTLMIPLFEVWRKIRDFSIVNADLILGVSTTTLAVLPKCYCNQKLFYPMPRDHAELDLNYFTDDGKISLCYVGGINRLLNMERIISIVRELTIRRNVEVHIIGSGEKKQLFIDMLKSADAVVVDHGELYDWKQKFPIYSKCSFGLNIPRMDAKVAMSLKGAEYLCASLPLLNEAIGDTEVLVKKYHAGINTRDICASKIAEIICSYSFNDIIEMKSNAKRLYKEEFERKNDFGDIDGN